MDEKHFSNNVTRQYSLLAIESGRITWRWQRVYKECVRVCEWRWKGVCGCFREIINERKNEWMNAATLTIESLVSEVVTIDDKMHVWENMKSENIVKLKLNGEQWTRITRYRLEFFFGEWLCSCQWFILIHKEKVAMILSSTRVFLLETVAVLLRSVLIRSTTLASSLASRSTVLCRNQL